MLQEYIHYIHPHMDHIEGNMFDPVEEATLVRPVEPVKLTDNFGRVLVHRRNLGPEPAAHGGHCHSVGLAEMVSGYKVWHFHIGTDTGCWHVPSMNQTS